MQKAQNKTITKQNAIQDTQYINNTIQAKTQHTTKTQIKQHNTRHTIHKQKHNTKTTQYKKNT